MRLTPLTTPPVCAAQSLLFLFLFGADFCSFPFAADEIAKGLGITIASKRMDSQAKYAVLARGEADIYLRFPKRYSHFPSLHSIFPFPCFLVSRRSSLMRCFMRGAGSDYRECIWDHAAGLAVLRSAGGCVTDALGQELDFSHGRRLFGNIGIVASNGHVHAPVIHAVKAVLDRQAAAAAKKGPSSATAAAAAASPAKH
jgi:3'-phosphoadenosine 5'-phosphosulfate (PAPS) 3'-phosphatase